MSRKQRKHAEALLVHLCQQYARERGMAFLNGEEPTECFPEDPSISYWPVRMLEPSVTSRS